MIIATNDFVCCLLQLDLFAIFFPLPVIHKKVLITNLSSFIFPQLFKFSLSYDNCLIFRIDDSGEPRVHTFTIGRVR